MAVGETCNCPKCGKRLRWPDAAGIQKARCSKCGQVFRLQTPAGHDDAPDSAEAHLGRPVKAILAALGVCGIALLTFLVVMAARPRPGGPPSNETAPKTIEPAAVAQAEPAARPPAAQPAASRPAPKPVLLTEEEFLGVEPPPTPVAPTSTQPKPLSAEELFAKASPAVVRVVVRDKDFKVIGLGSGFFVSADGLLVTNHHVVQGGEFATVLLDNNVSLFVEGVAAVDAETDLAILQVNGKCLPFLCVLDKGLPKVGAKVFAIGYPGGRSSFSEGHVTRLPFERRCGTLIESTASVGKGSSGGALLMPDGIVVGVTTGSLTKDLDLNVAVPAYKLNALKAARGKLQTLASAGGTPLDKQQSEQLDHAWEAMERKDWTQAAKLLTPLAMSEAQKKNPSVWFALGYLHRKLGNPDVAIAAYKAAIGLRADCASWHFNLGMAYIETERYPDAVAAAKAAIALQPDYGEAYVLLGMGYRGMKKYPESIAAYKTAIAKKPDDANLHYFAGGVYEDLRQYPEAITAYKAAISITPDDADAHYAMGHAYVKIKQYKEAVAAFKASIAIVPNEADAYFEIGGAYEQMKQHHDAIAAYDAAARLDPDGPIGQEAKALAAQVRALLRGDQ